jgi:LacI family transcriptional regulator
MPERLTAAIESLGYRPNAGAHAVPGRRRCRWYHPERQKPRIEGLIDRQVDGLVLVAPRLDAASIEQIGQGLPIVTVALHGTPKHFDTGVDEEGLGAARLVVDHLVALGHHRIVHTGTASGAWEGDFVLSHTARRQGFERAMREHGLPPPA